ncbi:hypothetical protein CAOG_05472 [Capsaspora owczarzaki ATCC 30864]|nr:hypothetical protein CAOG_05472 [Capsaspora owczarzaki ATCC 30864]|eukprot:XP_004346145.2 hypothetical protein CAOG_05472 [Capsaspora owczarzaki ATCC 30864]
MVQVATGSGSTNEQLPMVLKLPRLVDPYSGSCGVAYTVLGFGDLVMPSFLLAFCLMFDYRRHLVDTVVKGSLRGRLTLAMFETGKRRSARGSQDDAAGSADSLPHEHVGVNEAEPAVDVEAIISCAVLLRASHPNVTRGARPVYFFSCVFAYFVGLMATYATLVGSGKAQPALLYLVPSTLGCTLLVAWWRHELPLVWRGVHSLTDEVWEEYDRLRADAADENRTFSSRGGNTNIEDGATSSSSSSSSSRVSVSNRGRPRKESLDSDDADTERLL